MTEQKIVATLQVKQPTVFKKSPVQSSELEDGLKLSMSPNDTEYQILAFVEKGDHFLCTFNQNVGKFNTWYIWPAHVELRELEERNGEDEEEISFNQKPRDRGRKILIPGHPNGIYLNDPISDRSPNFFWYEALHGGTRIPVSAAISSGIVKQAINLQAARDKVNQSFRITSWYRDPATNARVGGARASRHLSGDATDQYVGNLNKKQMFDLFRGIWRDGGIGTYRRNGIVHLDSRFDGAGKQVVWYD